jgi:hypothetical protein
MNITRGNGSQSPNQRLDAAGRLTGRAIATSG